MRTHFLGLIILFAMVSIAAFLLKDQLSEWEVPYLVILGTNLLLFVLSCISVAMHIRAAKNSNPHAFVRTVMLGNILKLFGVAGAAFIYISAAGKEVSINVIFSALLLYILYTWVEKRATLRLNKSGKK